MSRRQNFRVNTVQFGRKTSLKQLSKIAAVTALSAVAIGLVWGTQQLYQWLNVPVSVIAVEGKFERITQQELQQLVKPLVVGGIVSLNLVLVRDKLQQHPWISAVRVSRQWPDGVKISVDEEVPIARWNESGFLNSRGQLMDIKDNSQLTGLPLLSGPWGSESEVMGRYRELSELIQLSSLGIATMAMSKRGSLRLQLANGVEVKLGKGNALEKMHRMLAVWNGGLAEKVARIATLDLRYTNGVSVSWNSVEEPGKQLAKMSTKQTNQTRTEQQLNRFPDLSGRVMGSGNG